MVSIECHLNIMTSKRKLNNHPVHLQSCRYVNGNVNYQFLSGDETFPIMFQLIIQFNVNDCLKKCLLSIFFCSCPSSIFTIEKCPIL